MMSRRLVALAITQLGAGMNASHVQVYGWVEVGGNVSTNSVKPGGKVPVGYDYTPNTVQLDQAVVYIERLPDTRDVEKGRYCCAC